MSICSPTICTGCGACFNVCPVEAISMCPDDEGFLQPVIDQHRCTKCGLCEKHCPVLHPPQIDQMLEPEVYAVWHKDKNTRRESSSGGAFSALAENVIDAGGVVFGAAYDGQMHVRHISVSTREELPNLRGSKYVQSATGETFREVRSFLKSG
ncbi:MAG: 4Fe-4S binding protein, partial [Deltaproteobacteria bacterium]|nr:4Fe-4S binding protein [Deltaproteobacteria bacterium]